MEIDVFGQRLPGFSGSSVKLHPGHIQFFARRDGAGGEDGVADHLAAGNGFFVSKAQKRVNRGVLPGGHVGPSSSGSLVRRCWRVP